MEMGRFDLLDVWSQADKYIVDNANTIFVVCAIVLSPVLITLITIGIGKIIVVNSNRKLKIKKAKKKQQKIMKQEQKKMLKQHRKVMNKAKDIEFTIDKLENIPEPIDKSQYSNLSIEFGLDGKQLK